MTRTVADERLTHGMNCPALSPGDMDAECVCGLEWRIQLATERTMHAAWRKRAEEAEAALVEAAKQRDELLAACKGIASTDFEEAHDIIEFGPGGTSSEFASQALIEQRMNAVRTAIARAESTRGPTEGGAS